MLTLVGLPSFEILTDLCEFGNREHALRRFAQDQPQWWALDPNGRSDRLGRQNGITRLPSIAFSGELSSFPAGGREQFDYPFGSLKGCLTKKLVRK